MPPPEFQDVLNAAAAFDGAAKALGGSLSDVAQHVTAAFQHMGAFLDKAAAMPQPKQMEDVTAMYQPVIAAVGSIEELSGQRGPFEFHVKAVHDGLGAVFWIVEKLPVPFVEEYIGAMQFNGNRVLTNAKNGGVQVAEHQAFIKTLTDVLRKLQAFVKDHHKTGLQWNSSSSSHRGSSSVDASHQQSLTSSSHTDTAAAELSTALNNVITETSSKYPANTCEDVALVLTLVGKVFDAHRDLLVYATQHPKPANAEALQLCLQPLSHALAAVSDAVDANSRSKQFVFLEALQLLCTLFAWVSIDSKPVPFIAENQEILEYTLTKIMKDGGIARDWALVIRAAATELKKYVTANHKTGLYFSGGGSGGAAGAGASKTSAPQSSSHHPIDSSSALDEALVDSFKMLPSLAVELTDMDLVQASEKIVALANAQRTFLLTTPTIPKPSDMSEVLSGMTRVMGELNDIVEKNSRHKTLLTHFQATGEVSNVFSWVCSDKPQDHLTEAIGSFDYYGNRILTEKKGDANHVAWLKALKSALVAVVTLVKQQYRFGLTWKSASAAAPPQKPAGVKGPPPPPPPPPSAGAAPAPSAAGGAGGDLAAVFKQIASQGLDITKSLRHVTDDQKAYKQQHREVRTVDEAELNAKKRKSKGHSYVPPTGVAKTQLQGDKKWLVEYYHGSGETETDAARVEIPDPNRKHAVHINRCYNAYVKIGGKVNSIQLVECANVRVELEDTVGPVEITASSDIEILIHGFVPNVIAGKVRGLTVHLGGENHDTEFVTSCSSSVNVTVGVVDADGDKDRIEMAIPEQFQSMIVGKNKVKTSVVEHSSA